MKRLTEYADCAGCASKVSASLLTELTAGLPPQDDPRILVDFRTADDAGVYRWTETSALVQTVDFFTPIVDDPYDFGQIAAANALSDVYAMGGQPRTALAITALPKDGPPANVIREIFRGGADLLKTAGVALLGGHTVTDPEIKFGYAITGEIDPTRIFTNATARTGDVLVLTKPLGTGIIVRARRFGQGTDAYLAGAVRSMKMLNDAAASAARGLGAGDVSACTDVTGFGLAGHASEMASASGVTLEITATDLPALPGALALAQDFLPCGGRANLKFYTGFQPDPSVSPEWQLLCQDPQTSGGLLLAMRPEVAPEFSRRLAESGAAAAVIGRVGGPRRENGPLVRLL
ncbi:MAG TPA: selenide, water dikinase SelD [Vicinamibacterales bacterium]|nr:selenide, water dikinase SelD [Vicinamibacterales bacterium]